MEQSDEPYSPYTKDGGREYHEAVNGGLSIRGYQLVARRRASKFQPYIQKSDTVLEYGVGTGWNMALLEARYRKGFDVAAAMRKQVESQGIEFVTELTESDSSAYDIVICSHVLEHLLHPADALAHIFSLLKPNGKALIYVPYDVEKRWSKYDINDKDHHLYGWNVQTLSNLAVLKGFSLEKGQLRRFGHERFVAKVVERLRLPDFAYVLLLRLAHFIRPTREVELILRKGF